MLRKWSEYYYIVLEREYLVPSILRDYFNGFSCKSATKLWTKQNFLINSKCMFACPIRPQWFVESCPAKGQFVPKRRTIDLLHWDHSGRIYRGWSFTFGPERMTALSNLLQTKISAAALHKDHEVWNRLHHNKHHSKDLFVLTEIIFYKKILFIYIILYKWKTFILFL